ncbi:receptor-like protein 9DC3 [Arachis stenosperma]|uniref:receptor-like protein 9DC3 n=1 Tax=Arachis stenosperma TaxID=217475 RepID=UPI0025ACB2A4|nr:receptor-like protein 9DC3 [Arachis stenosperma]
MMLVVVRVVVCVHIFMLFHFACLSSESCDLEESSALLHFKTQLTTNTTFFDGWYEHECPNAYPKMSTWENGTDCCSWMGVTCDSLSGHVIGLDLSCSGLVGIIHPNSTLFHLTHLQTLNFAHNYIYNSQLSSQFGGFMSLTHLNLSDCEFKGEVPSQISHLSKLQSLDLSSNYDLMWKESTWKRMLQNATALREIILDDTDMSSISITPSHLSNWSFSFSLVTLSLVFTGISGNLTSHILCLPNLYELNLYGNSNIQVHVPKLNCNTSLNFLDLSWCQFSGSQIPSSFSNLTHLTSLHLSGSESNGSIPSWLSNLQHLTHLDLSDNRFSGSIPSLFSNLQHLTYLDLSHNEFSGSIPSLLSKLQHLTHLDLSGNRFCGSIPSFLSILLSNISHLTHLDLSFNRFNGQFPKVLGQLTKLQTLILTGNNLGGKLLLSSLANLTQISRLDCSHNKFQGPLPKKITGFSSLTELILNDNMLNETIPSWCFSLPFLTSLDLSNNQFTGHISSISSHSLQYLQLCGNKLQGNIPESMFNLVNLTDLCLSSGNWSYSLHSPLFSKLQKLQNLEVLSLSGFNSLILDSSTNSSYNRFSNLEALQLLQFDLTNFSKISWKFPKLQILELSENKLEGKIPKWIRDSHSLESLELSHNQLSSIGQFPWYQLEYLDLSFNLLTDDNISFLCNATSLQVINLSHNKFRGTIPQCVANLSSLSVLDLQTNKFHGTLPSNFSRNLNTLNLNGNQLEGHLPRSLSNCKDLMDLNLGDNQIKDTFPHWVQSLQILEILVLRSNKFYGPIVSFKTKDAFHSLIIFDISSNKFSGQLPKSYIKGFQAMKSVVGAEVQSRFYYINSGIGFIIGSIDLEYDDSVTATMKGLRTNFEKIPNFLVSIDLSSNRFEGEIPDEFGELGALIGLNLSHNNLIGPIPRSLGNLTNLESLDLSSNMLDGEIPAELTNLNFLASLNLSNNHLEGSIPRGKQFDTFSNDSYEGNIGLCGLPLSIQCNNNVPLQQDPPSEAEDKFGFGWKPVAIGYACGMVLGIGLGFCVFSIGKPQWLVIIFGGKRIKRKSRRNRRA